MADLSSKAIQKAVQTGMPGWEVVPEGVTMPRRAAALTVATMGAAAADAAGGNAGLESFPAAVDVDAVGDAAAAAATVTSSDPTHLLAANVDSVAVPVENLQERLRSFTPSWGNAASSTSSALPDSVRAAVDAIQPESDNDPTLESVSDQPRFTTGAIVTVRRTRDAAADAANNLAEPGHAYAERTVVLDDKGEILGYQG